MDLLAQLFAADGTPPGPTSDFWYGPVGTQTIAGVRIDAEGAKKISAWFRGREILATSLAMLPLQMYQRLPNDEGAEVAENHPLHDALHRKPNESDDSFTWRCQLVYDLIDHGNAYCWIRIGTRWELPRIDPSLVSWRRNKSGRIVYAVRDATTGQTTTHTSDEIFHLRRPDGKGILESARDSLGLASVTEQYAGRIFSKGFLNGGIIEVVGPMEPEAMKTMAQSFVTSIGEWHMPRVLPKGAQMAKHDGLTPDKAQMLASRQHTIDDIARWLGVPRMMLENSDPSFGNAEQFNQNFVTYSLGPWLSLVEFAINDQLILQPARFYAEFTRDALVRGDIAARWQAYTAAITTGTFVRNEVRRKENMKALPGLDTPLDPAHLTGNQNTGKPPAGQTPKPAPKKADPSDKATAIVQQSAARLLRKEIAAVQKMAVRHAADQDAFAGAVTEFYAKHAELVADTLQMASAEADGYCAGQSAQVLDNWIAALELWNSDHYAAGLAALALEEAA